MQVVESRMLSGKGVRLVLIWTIIICIFMCMIRRQAQHPPEAPGARLGFGPTTERHGGGERWRKATRRNSSKERTNIFFLKTHKCGSSTVQNILMRFGYTRHLDFVLPRNGNYLGYGTFHFHPNCVAKEIMSPNRTFNIFAHHTRFDYANVKEVMEPDAAFVTILREPSYVFEALYYYYDFVRPMKMGLKQLVRSPKEWPRAKQRGARTIYGTNQISWDLGFDTVNFDSKARNASKIVKRFIRQIDRAFDLVMITEHMEASLVLLCDLMNWPLEHVVHLQLNKRRWDRVKKLEPSERYMLLKMNPVDTQVYQHFLNKFRGLIRDFGTQKMKSQVGKLLDLNSDLKRSCRFDQNYEGFRRTASYAAQSTTDALCHYVSLNELTFTRIIREDQFNRCSVLRKLDALVADLDYDDVLMKPVEVMTVPDATTKH